jgi:hypothetical protein
MGVVVGKIGWVSVTSFGFMFMVTLIFPYGCALLISLVVYMLSLTKV